jgi:uracil-DNA glycosylase
MIMSVCKWFSVCPMKTFFEDGTLSKKWIDQYCMGDWESCKRYYMEENGISHPDWMLPDGTIDEQLHNA